MEKLANHIDRLNKCLGSTVSWMALGMVLMMTFNVLIRYALSEGIAWQQEIVRFMHGILFLGGSAYALKSGAMVRVDVFYQNMSERGQARVNIIGTLLFLYPTCFALIYFTHSTIAASWQILEGSSEYRGMPGVFLFKSFIWVYGFTLALQGLSMILHSLGVLKGEPQ